MLAQIEDFPFPSNSDVAALVDEAGVTPLRGLMSGEGVFLLARSDVFTEYFARFVFPRAGIPQRTSSA